MATDESSRQYPSRDIVIAAFKDYFTFLTTTPLVEADSLKVPKKGWKTVDAAALGVLGKTDAVYDFLRQMPHFDQRELRIAGNSTLEEITAWVSSPSDYTLGNVQHWSSSCRFDTCVDLDAKVIGTSNIHVVDASISAPLTTNPVLGTMIIAERASEKILAL